MTEKQSYIEKLIKEKEGKEKRSKGKEKRFTVVLSNYDFNRLEYIINELGEVRSTFVRNIILEALDKSEKALGLEEFAYDQGSTKVAGEDVYVHTSYGNYINKIDHEKSDDDN